MWYKGILKSMIGKDMTKMTLPVSFNEPTSLLQRVTEDMVRSPFLFNLKPRMTVIIFEERNRGLQS